MKLQKYRWSTTYEAAEAELVAILKKKNIDAERWEAEPDEEFTPHIHPKDKKIWCVEGIVVFGVNGQQITLQAGDAMDLPANTTHDAKAGFMGCACYEFPRLADNVSLKS